MLAISVSMLVLAAFGLGGIAGASLPAMMEAPVRSREYGRQRARFVMSFTIAAAVGVLAFLIA